MTTLILECHSFTATPLENGKMRLDITGATHRERDPEESYEASRALARLSSILGRPVSRGNLAYWRENMHLPYKKIGLKKFVYQEADLVRWAKGRSGVITA